MEQAKTGDTVKVHYTGKLNDGTVFDSSVDRDPIQFTIGEGQIIPDFEQAIIGMTPEESKSVHIPAERAYGPHHEEMVLEVDKSNFPPDLSPSLEQRLQVTQADGKSFVVTVTAISEQSVTLDGNHPLAGKDLDFDIKLLEIA